MAIRWYYVLACDSPGCDTYDISAQGLGRVHREAAAAGWEQERCAKGHITGQWYCAVHSGPARRRPPCPQAHGYPDQAAYDRRPRRLR